MSNFIPPVEQPGDLIGPDEGYITPSELDDGYFKTEGLAGLEHNNPETGKPCPGREFITLEADLLNAVGQCLLCGATRQMLMY